MSFLKIVYAHFLFLSLLPNLAFSYSLPLAFKKLDSPKEHGEKLDHILIEVEGKNKKIFAGETLEFFRGDKIKILDAILENKNSHPQTVNLIGYKSKKKGVDDRGELIKTENELTGGDKKWCLESSCSVFGVAIFSENTLHGQAFIKRIDPRLDYVEIEVNKTLQILRQGEPFRLNQNDTFKVSKIHSNLPTQKNLEVEILQNETLAGKKQKRVDIVFSRRNFEFGTVSLIVEQF